MKVNEILTEAGIIDKLVANIKSVTTKDPRLAAMTTDQKVDYFLRQPGLQKASDLAREIWEKQLVATMSANQAAGKGLTSISDQEYRNMLNNFVEKSLINAKINNLDNENQQRVNSAVVNVLRAKGRDDQRAMDAAFDDLVSVASVARIVDSSAVQSTSTQSNTSSTSGPSVKTGRQARIEVDRFLNSGGFNKTNQQAVKQFLDNQTARSTGNDTVDELLKQLGVNVT